MGPYHSTNAKTYKLTVEDCIALDTAMLRKRDMLLDWMDHRLPLQWQLGRTLVGDLILTTTFTGDIAYPSLRIDGTCFGRPIVQTVRLVSKAMRFGGKRWYLVCPSTKRLCCKLILPPKGELFGSVKAWGLAYRSQRHDAVARAQSVVEALHKRVAAMPKYTRTSTLKAVDMRILAKEAFLERVQRHCELQLQRGSRLSLRKAAQAACRRSPVE